MNFMNEGGFGMYPTLVFGSLSVLAAVVIALKPERRFLPMVLALSATTFGSGMLGAVMGFILSLRAVANAPEADRMVLAIGAAESLNNMVLALVLVVLTGLIASVAAARVALSSRLAANA
jgi:hypothetical protein